MPRWVLRKHELRALEADNDVQNIQLALQFIANLSVLSILKGLGPATPTRWLRSLTTLICSP